MPAFIDNFLAHPDLALLLAIPFLAAALGAASQWLGWQLLFGPLPLKETHKWRQGLLGGNAGFLAQQMGEKLSPRVSLSELVRSMEPERIAGHVTDSVMLRLDDYIDEIMMERYSVIWANLPVALRQRMYARVRKQLPSILDNLVDDMAEHVDLLIDLPSLLREELGTQPARLTDMLKDILQPEKHFLLRAGMYSGALLGCIELFIWAHSTLPAWALLALSVAIAIFSYWFPRRLLLYPLAPTPFMGKRRQGFVYQQTPAFSERLAAKLVDEVFSLGRLMQVLLSGQVARRVRGMVKRHLRPLMDAGLVRTTIQLLLGAEGYANIKQSVVDRAVTTTIQSLSDASFSLERTALIEDVCRRHFQGMDPVETHALLEPFFTEETWAQYVTVIAAGSLLGLAQWLWVIVF